MPIVHSRPVVWRKMSNEELRLAKMWYEEDGMSPNAIAALLHRDKSILTRHLVMRREKKTDAPSFHGSADRSDGGGT